MDLDTFTPSESPESSSNSAEISEKIQESIKRWAAWIKRTRKDEQKAKRNDILLAWFLVKIIIDKTYDFVLDDLFLCLNKGFSSNILLGIISLVHEEISEKIRLFSGKDFQRYTFKYQQKTQFDDSQVDIAVKQRINTWVEDIVDIISIDYSHVQIEELRNIFIIHNQEVSWFTQKVFTFFLEKSNIEISESQAWLISEFILSEIEKSIENLEISEV